MPGGSSGSFLSSIYLKGISTLSYVDNPTIRFNTKESVEMPFRYIEDKKEPLLPPGMRELLHEDLNKSFDF